MVIARTPEPKPASPPAQEPPTAGEATAEGVPSTQGDLLAPSP